MKRIVELQLAAELPECWRKDVMANEILKAKVRQWRELQPRYEELKPLLSAGRRVEDNERSLRKEIGELMGDKLSILIDGKTLIHSKEERNNGLDYEKAWTEAVKVLPPCHRRRIEKLLKPKLIVIHKLATE